MGSSQPLPQAPTAPGPGPDLTDEVIRKQQAAEKRRLLAMQGLASTFRTQKKLGAKPSPLGS